MRKFVLCLVCTSEGSDHVYANVYFETYVKISQRVLKDAIEMYCNTGTSGLKIDPSKASITNLIELEE